MRALVTRTDRLGDLLLSLPTLEYLRRELPGCEIDFLCQPQYVEVIEGFAQAQRIKPVEKAAARYDAALFLFFDPRIIWSTMKIPLRCGIYSKPLSFILLNSGKFQRRSRADKSEAQYNLELAQRFLKIVTGKILDTHVCPITLPRNETAAEAAKKHLQKVGVTDSFVLLHPGTGGSALTPSPEQYLKLIESFGALPFVISIGPSAHDQEILASLKKRKSSLKILEGLRLNVLMEVFRLASLLIAPSTGPLHLAHYVGTKTIGLYAPVKSQDKGRWAPSGGRGKGFILSPEVACAGIRECVGSSCRHYYCMDEMPWARLISEKINALRTVSGL